jgi:hypothetical protein
LATLLILALLAAALMVADELDEKSEEGRCWSLNMKESRAVCALSHMTWGLCDQVYMCILQGQSLGLCLLLHVTRVHMRSSSWGDATPVHTLIQNSNK